MSAPDVLRYPRARPYWRIAVAGFRRQATYRLAALGGLTANATFGFLKVAVLFAAVDAAGGELRGYDTALISAYIWVSQGLLGSVNLMGRSDAADRIKDGSIAVEFLRPVDVHLSAVCAEIGQAVFTLLPRGVPSVLIGVFVVGMAVPDSPWPYLLGSISVLLGIAVSAATAYLVAVVGFWLVDTRGVQVLYMVVSGFLAGLYVPIVLFPPWLLAVAEATPFPSMLMYPTDVLTGRVDGVDALVHVGAQMWWLAVVLTLGQILTRAGRRTLEVQGG
ncbi:ABC-2 family transporter protein [Nocardioides sp. R-C-SC26]|uniref:ABC transporter permease n=1 Tax=Nocardioides sp. R-C-SC26 TaxID=2870414 RepID=UPI001E4AF4CC|nr:ABC-2 family transporter protein [Nocardioides sp. R-C-SC26]